jgi:hypothetical protein
MIMAKQMCQSCGMPIKKDAVKGTEKDGSLSQKYCMHCYQKGEFTWKDATAEKMQTYCLGILMKKHWPGFMAKMATSQIPKLERWKT